MGLPLLLVLVAAGIGAAVWYYRDPSPKISRGTARLLTALRALALILLLVGLAEPVVNMIITVTGRDTAVVLLDLSASMETPGDPERKRAALDALETFRRAADDRAVFMGFHGSLVPLERGEPLFSGASTDILSAIRGAVARTDAVSVVLISDGRWNLGENPAGTGLPDGVRVHAVLTGSPVSRPDYVIRSISASPIGHEGSRLPVEITIASSSASDASIAVTVMGDGGAVGRGTVSLGGGSTARTVIEIPLDSPGYHRHTVTIDPDDDRLPDNNARSFGVTVLKSSFRILVAAAAPSPDLAFVRRVIEGDDSFEVDTVVSRGVRDMNAPPEGSIGTNDYDAVILIDGGGQAIDSAAARRIAGMVENGAGLWLVGSEAPADAASPLLDTLPVSFGQGKRPLDGEFSVIPTERGAAHFVTSGIEEPGRRRDWNDLPSLRSLRETETRQEANVLATAVSPAGHAAGEPVIVGGRHGAGKVLVMPVSGIWRWRLMLEGAGGGGGFFSSFVLGTLRWLTSDAETSPLVVSTDRPTYLSGQEITFEGRLFDNVYMPVPNADISLVIDDDPARKVFLEETSPAVYTGSARGVEPGEHRFTATAWVGDTLFAETTGSFTVERFSLEMLDPSPAPEVMSGIAALTGGLAVTPAGVDSVVAELPESLRRERTEEDAHPYLNPLLPLAAIMLFVTEWIIRKRRGML